jgi:hypothetical protein
VGRNREAIPGQDVLSNANDKDPFALSGNAIVLRVDYLNGNTISLASGNKTRQLILQILATLEPLHSSDVLCNEESWVRELQTTEKLTIECRSGVTTGRPRTTHREALTRITSNKKITGWKLLYVLDVSLMKIDLTGGEEVLVMSISLGRVGIDVVSEDNVRAS